MSIIRIKDKTFKTSITEAEIKARIKVLAQQINKDMESVYLCCRSDARDDHPL